MGPDSTPVPGRDGHRRTRAPRVSTRIEVGWVSHPAKPPYNGGMRQLRLVVVDDHPIYRRGLVALLEQGGVAVVGVADGIEGAVAAVRSTRPDAVLIDLYLSDGSGIALV